MSEGVDQQRAEARDLRIGASREVRKWGPDRWCCLLRRNCAHLVF
jgi:hypothetical protein